jgi:DNA polymerase-4
MDAFFAAVEQHDHPEYRGKPVVIGAPPDQRGVVSAASYEARKFGIHSAMPSSEAGRRCPGAVFLPVNGERYREVSLQIRAIFKRFTPLVEPMSIDEAFLDVTGSRRLFGTGPEIAAHIRSTIQAETGLTASVGVAPNKFLAKLASDLDKPDGLTVVPTEKDAILRFLAPLSVSRAWGVGKVTQRHLEAARIRTIGQLQEASGTFLATLVGEASAKHLKSLAMGSDSRSIELDHEEKSISHEHTYLEDSSDPEQLQVTLCRLVNDVGSRLRAAGKYAGTAHLKLRWQSFKTITRQRQFAEACCDDFTLREMALDIFHNQTLVLPVRLIGFGVSKLTRSRANQQLSLLENAPETLARREALSHAVDTVRKQFGKKTVRSGHGPTR